MADLKEELMDDIMKSKKEGAYDWKSTLYGRKCDINVIFAQQLVFGAPSEPEQSTASPTLNNKLGEVRQSRKITMEGGRPWGFKIAGGAEVNKPIIITKIDPDGQGAKFGIQEGDMIASVNGTSLRYFVTRKEAVQHIKRGGENIVIEIQPNPTSNWRGKSAW